MKQVCLVLKFMLVCLLVFKIPGFAANQKLPLINGKGAVAAVNDEPITLEELNQATAASHEKRSKGAKAGRVDFSNILNRLINTRLLLLEARNMGLDELPEITSTMDAYSRQTLMEVLLERYVKDIEVDEDEVDTIYQSIVREWKIKSVRLKKEKDAKKIESQLKEGQDFGEVVQKAIEWGIAEGDEQAAYVKNKDLARPVARIISTMSIGSTSPVLSIGKKGFIIFKLEDIRIPEIEDSKARQKARRQALNNKRVKAAKAYYGDLKKRHVKINEALFESLDYESKEPGLEKLFKDKRVVAEIKGKKPITVGEFSQALKQKLYHGVKLAIEGKRMNSRKHEVLEDMLQKRILLKEALRQGIDKTDEYKYRVKNYEASVLFGIFINKVIRPGIKLDIQDLKTYYRENSEVYSSPQMMRIQSLVFSKRDDAVHAINILKKGTDFNWLSSNTENQIEKNTKGLLNLEGKLLTVRSLPEDLQKAVSRTKPGDFRLYTSPEGHFYVLFITQILPPAQQPFEAVRQEIAKEVFNQKVKKEIQQWADQLKAYYPVKIYRAEFMK
jgi:hypothetical protein